MKLEERLALPAENLMVLEATMFKGGKQRGDNKGKQTGRSLSSVCCSKSGRGWIGNIKVRISWASKFLLRGLLARARLFRFVLPCEDWLFEVAQASAVVGEEAVVTSWDRGCEGQGECRR